MVLCFASAWFKQTKNRTVVRLLMKPSAQITCVDLVECEGLSLDGIGWIPRMAAAHSQKQTHELAGGGQRKKYTPKHHCSWRPEPNHTATPAEHANGKPQDSTNTNTFSSQKEAMIPVCPHKAWKPQRCSQRNALPHILLTACDNG